MTTYEAMSLGRVEKPKPTESLFKQYANTRKMNKGKESICSFFIACRNSTELLQFPEKAFHTMPFFIVIPIT